MNKWKASDLEEVEIKIKVPKGTVAFIVNAMVDNDDTIAMYNKQYASDDIKKLLENEREEN